MNTGLQLKNIEEAVLIYYGRIELSNNDIKKLFGCGDGSAIKLKKIAKEKAIAENYHHIRTKSFPWYYCLNSEAP
jgi:hypothetical protein